MNAIKKQIKKLKFAKRKALVAYITVGFPNIKMTEKLVKVMEKSGVDFIELGLPFSDPIADGPTIQMASAYALKQKINLAKFFRLTIRLKKITKVPLIIMTYYNPVYQYGLARFARQAKHCGLAGVIIPDLPIEEAKNLLNCLRAVDIPLIFLLSPVTKNQRLKKIAQISSGFIYYVSVTGVTGARHNLPDNLMDNLSRVKKITAKPIYVGFGISNANQAKRIFSLADGVIIGSALINIIVKNQPEKYFLKKIGAFLARFHRMTNIRR